MALLPYDALTAALDAWLVQHIPNATRRNRVRRAVDQNVNKSPRPSEGRSYDWPGERLVGPSTLTPGTTLSPFHTVRA